MALSIKDSAGVDTVVKTTVNGSSEHIPHHIVDSVTAALPAGTNNIGDVDVLTMPGTIADASAALPATIMVIGGFDGTNVRRISTNASGVLNTVGSFTLSAALPAGTNNIGDVDVLSVIPSTGVTNLGKAVDQAATGADVGVALLAVRDDALSALTPAEGDYCNLRVDSTGALYVTGVDNTEYAEDTVHTTGDVGTLVLAVRNDSGVSLVGSDGDYASLSVDANGALYVTGAIGSTQYQEDTSHSSGDTGTMMLAVRNDNFAAIRTNADGDYSPISVDSVGKIGISIVGNILPGNGASYLGKLEDSAHSSGDLGVFVLAVRNDAGTALSADGDYSALQVDSTGALRVSGGGGGTQYAEDTGHSTGDTGTMALAVRNDAGTTLAGTDLDYAPLSLDANGALRVTGGGGGTEYTVDAVAPAAPVGGTSLLIRDDTLGTVTEADGDWTTPRANSRGATWVVHDGAIAASQSGIWSVAVSAITKAEDAGHSTGDSGVMGLAVRNDALAALATTDLDYIPLSTNNVGRLWTSAVIDTALPAGTNNIGDVDILSVVPGTGATNLGKAVDSAAGGTDTGVLSLFVRQDTLSAITPAVNDYTHGHVDANGAIWTRVVDGVKLGSPTAATYIGDVGVTSVVPGTAATSLGKAEDAAHSSGDVGVMALGVRQDTQAALGADGDYTPPTMNSLGAMRVQTMPHTSGGLTVARDIDLDEATPANIKNSAGMVYGWYFYNNTSSVIYVKLYNLSAAPVLASDTPLMTLAVPPNGGANAFIPQGIEFSNGIGWAATTGVIDTSAVGPVANGMIANLFYK